MTRLLTCVTAALVGAWLGAPAADAGGKQDKGWVQLFNGKDLTGWKTHPDNPGKWRVENGVIVSDGDKVSHLFSDRDDYENFHYRIEAKISDKGNSGQYFRTKFGPGYPKGYEAQINSTFPSDPQRTGSLYSLVKITDKLVEPDTWFTQEVIAKGNHIQILVNGKKVVDYKDDKNTYTKGHFALQQHSAYKDKKDGKVVDSVLHVKKIEVKELAPSGKTEAKKEDTKKKSDTAKKEDTKKKDDTAKVKMHTMDDYWTLADQAFKDKKPIVVLVNVQRADLEKTLGDCVVLRMVSFPDAPKSAVIVGVPNQRWLSRTDYPGNVPPEIIRRALPPEKLKMPVKNK